MRKKTERESGSTIGVYFPPKVKLLADERAEVLGQSFSGYVVQVVKSDLKTAGMIEPEVDYSEVHDAVMEATRRHGRHVVMQALANLLRKEVGNG